MFGMKRGWRLPLAVLVCAAASSVTVQAVGGGIVGTWKWIGGQTLVVESDGSCRVYQGQQQINHCRWIVTDEARRSYRITHQSGGWIDTLTLSADGGILDVVNNVGTRFRGERVTEGLATLQRQEGVALLDLTGTWKWVGGQTLVVKGKDDCQVLNSQKTLINTCHWKLIDPQTAQIDFDKYGFRDRVELQPKGKLRVRGNTGASFEAERIGQGPESLPSSLTGPWVHSADPKTQTPESKVIVIHNGSRVTLTHAYIVNSKWVTLVCNGPIEGRDIKMECKWAPGGNPWGYSDGVLELRVSSDANHLDGRILGVGAPGLTESHYSRIPSLR